ncbi:MAG: PHP domain-containing protein, partial [Oscillospiraceae bacterium]
MDNRFKTLFSACTKTKLQDAMLEAEVLYIDTRRESGEIEITIRPERLLCKELIGIAQDEIKKTLELTQVKIHTKYTKDMFTGDYFPEIIFALKSTVAMINGYFDEAVATYENNKLTIEIKQGGADLLQKCNVDKEIAKFIATEFSFNINIGFTGVLDADKEKFEASLPIETGYDAPPPISNGDGYYDNSSEKSTSKPKKEKTQRINLSKMPFECEYGAIVLGKKIAEKPMPLSDVDAMSGRVVVCGEVFAKDVRYSRDNSKVIMSIDFTDYTSSNTLKIIDDKKNEKKLESIVKGSVIIARGDCSYDKYDKEVTIRPYDIMTYKKIPRQDDAKEKRVELHLHTIMSSMDAIIRPKDIINTAFNWGHKAVAITDHGVLQGFPEAMYAVDSIRKNGGDFK